MFVYRSEAELYQSNKPDLTRTVFENGQNSLHDQDVACIHEDKHQTLPPVGGKNKEFKHRFYSRKCGAINS